MAVGKRGGGAAVAEVVGEGEVGMEVGSGWVCCRPWTPPEGKVGAKSEQLAGKGDEQLCTPERSARRRPL